MSPGSEGYAPLNAYRKIMQSTYTAKGDRWVERILSVRETCRLRGIPTFPVLVDAVTCYVNGQPPRHLLD